jgi:hypothetical protein
MGFTTEKSQKNEPVFLPAKDFAVFFSKGTRFFPFAAWNLRHGGTLWFRAKK